MTLCFIVDNGVESIYDEQWTSTYKSAFTADSLQIPWYAILGNHDYKGNPDVQIEYYTKHMDDRWTMPSHLYSCIYTIPTGNNNSSVPQSIVLLPESIIDNQTLAITNGTSPTVQVIFIDTLIIAPHEDEATKRYGRHYVSPESAKKYLDSFENMLASSTATWLIIAGHYTIYSIADHGDTKALIRLLTPLFKKYGVHAYFNGHDHVLQHIEREKISYFTSGHGTHSDNFPLGAYNVHLSDPVLSEGFKFGANGPGFATVTASATTLTVGFIDKHGEELYNTVFSNPYIRPGLTIEKATSEEVQQGGAPAGRREGYSK